MIMIRIRRIGMMMRRVLMLVLRVMLVVIFKDRFGLAGKDTPKPMLGGDGVGGHH